MLDYVALFNDPNMLHGDAVHFHGNAFYEVSVKTPHNNCINTTKDSRGGVKAR
jgi:hypothetical protein